MILSHLLENLNEEADLNLGCLLEESIQSSRSFSLAQNSEPLFDGAQLVLEILVEGCSSHLLQRSFILVNVGDPLLSNLVRSIIFSRTLSLALLSAVEIRRWSDTIRGGRREIRHVCGRT